jgi:hypothetical protein
VLAPAPQAKVHQELEHIHFLFFWPILLAKDPHLQFLWHVRWEMAVVLPNIAFCGTNVFVDRFSPAASFSK